MKLGAMMAVFAALVGGRMRAQEKRVPTEDGIVYGVADGQTLTMDYYAPKGPLVHGETQHPIAIIIHGGGYHGGDAKSGSEAYVADFLAPDGKQLQAGLVGLEPWNRATLATADDMQDPFCVQQHEDANACFQHDSVADQYARLEEGIKDGWQPLLQRGLAPRSDKTNAPLFKAFLAAGSDAHGDLNYEATMDVTDFLGKPSRSVNGYAEDNALGQISTVVYAPEGMGPRGENVLRALREGRTVGSNGPILIAGFDRNRNGSLDDRKDVGIGQEINASLKSLPPLQLRWVSSPEFGPLQSIKLIVGTSHGESPAVEVPVPRDKALASDTWVPFDLHQVLTEGSKDWIYIRLVASTRNSANSEFRCYTNPIWIRATGK